MHEELAAGFKSVAISVSKEDNCNCDISIYASDLSKYFKYFDGADTVSVNLSEFCNCLKRFSESGPATA